jgi:hypothetical protein
VLKKFYEIYAANAHYIRDRKLRKPILYILNILFNLYYIITNI